MKVAKRPVLVVGFLRPPSSLAEDRLKIIHKYERMRFPSSSKDQTDNGYNRDNRKRIVHNNNAAGGLAERGRLALLRPAGSSHRPPALQWMMPTRRSGRRRLRPHSSHHIGTRCTWPPASNSTSKLPAAGLPRPQRDPAGKKSVGWDMRYTRPYATCKAPRQAPLRQVPVVPVRAHRCLFLGHISGHAQGPAKARGLGASVPRA